MTEERKAPPAAWYLLFVVTVILTVAMIDRLSLTLLVEPIKRDLHIGDVQVSLLLGLSFALPFSLFGLPAGYLVDKYPRRTLMAIGGLLWSVMTLASGLAPSFAWLFACRAGLGLGEAILSPCAYSLIRDAFPARQQPMAFGLHNIGGPLGAGLSLIIVGKLSRMDSIHLPGDWSTLAAWRVALCLVGVASLISVLVLASVRDPGRGSEPAAGARDGANVRATAQYIGARWPIYVSLFSATALYSIASLSIAAWLPTGFSRLFALPIDQVSQPLGLIQIVAPILGLGLAVVTLTALNRKAPIRRIALIGAAAMLLSTLALTTAIFSPARQASWTAITVVAFFHPWIGVVVATMLAWFTPSRMMGKVAAINFLLIGLVGTTFGPTLVPIIAFLFKGPAAIAYAIAVCGGAAYFFAAVALYFAGAASRNTDRSAVTS
ncbi:MAG: MFS transporter [Caulobacteraceae bacterium]